MFQLTHASATPAPNDTKVSFLVALYVAVPTEVLLVSKIELKTTFFTWEIISLEFLCCLTDHVDVVECTRIVYGLALDSKV